MEIQSLMNTIAFLQAQPAPQRDEELSDPQLDQARNLLTQIAQNGPDNSAKITAQLSRTIHDNWPANSQLGKNILAYITQIIKSEPQPTPPAANPALTDTSTAQTESHPAQTGTNPPATDSPANHTPNDPATERHLNNPADPNPINPAESYPTSPADRSPTSPAEPNLTDPALPHTAEPNLAGPALPQPNKQYELADGPQATPAPWEFPLGQFEVDNALPPGPAERSLFNDRYLESTAIIGFIALPPMMVLTDLRAIIGNGVLNHVTLNQQLTATRALEKHPAAVQEALAQSAAAGTITVELLNATLESALDGLADLDTPWRAHLLLVGTHQPDITAVFFADARLNYLLRPVSIMAETREVTAFLAGCSPSLPFTKEISPRALARGLWGRRLYGSFLNLDGEEQWRTLIAEQNQGGDWRFEEYGRTLPWEDTESYRHFQPEKRLTAQHIETYLSRFLIRPWHTGFYRAPIIRIGFPRLCKSTSAS